MSSIRKLTQADYDMFEAFLAETPTTTMFMRANAAANGLDNTGKKYQADYFGLFDGDALTGVIALNWNQNIMMQCRDDGDVEFLLRAALEQAPDFQCKGVLAPDPQAQRILQLIKPDADNIQMSETEITYHLKLDQMVLPEKLESGKWECRQIEAKDIPVLAEWGVAYEAEALGRAPGKDDLENERRELKERLGQNIMYVLLDGGKLVAKAAFNARMKTIVQVGGVYTPPELRGRGYGGAVVAGELRLARQAGVVDGLLFTKNPAAIKAYEKLGFVRRDDYHLSLFKTAFRPQMEKA